MQELDSSGLLSGIALLIACRQDAVAASNAHSDAPVRIAAAVGELAQDWPQAKPLCCGKGVSPTSSQKDPYFLTAAYPLVFVQSFRSAASRYNVPPQLLYSVVREESFFYPEALSADGALGLFQFLPSTFKSLDQGNKYMKGWHLLEQSGTRSYSEFLLDPDRSIDLGARYFGEYLLPVNNRNLLAAVVEQNTNREFVKAWMLALQAQGRSRDVECAIESIRYVDTRLFVKGVLADVAVITAVGALGDGSQQAVRSPAFR
jgi:soluble lytic murein transglycosylase